MRQCVKSQGLQLMVRRLGLSALCLLAIQASGPEAKAASTELHNDAFTTQGCTLKLEPLGPAYLTNNRSAVPSVGKRCNRYYAEIRDNRRNKTLHYHKDQGRFDGIAATFPFEVVIRNIGIGTLRDTQSAPVPTGKSYVFAGVQVHATAFNSLTSAHVVVGHRGQTSFTVEGKNTVKGRSKVNDVGKNVVPGGRADLRIVGGRDRTLTVYWQKPNLAPTTQQDQWNMYRGNGKLPGTHPVFGSRVYVGLITYAYGQSNLPFVGTADSIKVTKPGS